MQKQYVGNYSLIKKKKRKSMRATLCFYMQLQGKILKLSKQQGSLAVYK